MEKADYCIGQEVYVVINRPIGTDVVEIIGPCRIRSILYVEKQLRYGIENVTEHIGPEEVYLRQDEAMEAFEALRAKVTNDRP